MLFYLKKIFHSLEYIKQDQKSLRKAIDEMKRFQQQPPCEASVTIDFFPLKTQEELNNFERKALEQTLRESIVSRLHFVQTNLFIHLWV